MKLKPLVWVSSSKKDLSKFPEDIEDAIGYALYYAQKGIMHKDAKALKGFGSADVIEIIEMDESGTYRAVYTVQMQGFVFVLHVFQKKSKQGIKTPKPEIDLINNRIKQAKEMYKELLNKKK